MTDKKPTLQDLRDEIDHVDNQILDLLDQRSRIVDRVKQVKTGCIFRPGREADMLDALRKKYQGLYPFTAIYAIWREIISATLRKEGTFNVIALAKDDEMVKLCHHQFGVLTPLTRAENMNKIFDKLLSDEAAVAILPSDNMESWMSEFYQNKDKLWIVGALPYLTKHSMPRAFMVTQADPEKSENDIELYLEESLSGAIRIDGKKFHMHQIPANEKQPENMEFIGRYSDILIEEQMPF